MVSISVIVPIYNAQKHLKECLDSLKSQSLKEIEFILIDDGSIDESGNICQNYLNDKRFFYKKTINQGHVAAYLEGFQNAKGEYIGFVDSDDYIDKDMFLKMYQIAKENDDDIVICDKFDIDDLGKILNQKTPKIIVGNHFKENNIKSVYDLTFPPFNGYHLQNSRWNKIFRKEIFAKNIKYCASNPRTFEDRFIVPSCIFSSKSISIIDDKLYYYRHAENTVHTRSRKDLFDILKNLKSVQKEMLVENNVFDEYKNKYEIAQLNYLSLFVDRNIITHGSFKEKMYYAKQIINDKEYQELIKAHKKDMNGKKGKLLKLCYFFKSPLLLSVLSYLGKK